MVIVRGALVGVVTGVACAGLVVVGLVALDSLISGPDEVLIGWAPLILLLGVASAIPAGAFVGGVSAFVADYVHATQPFERARLAGAGCSAGMVLVAGLLGEPSLGFILSFVPMVVVAVVAYVAMSRSMRFILGASAEPPAYGTVRAPRPAWQRFALVGLVALAGFWLAAAVTGQVLTAQGVDRQSVDLAALGGAIVGALLPGGLTLRLTR